MKHKIVYKNDKIITICSGDGVLLPEDISNVRVLETEKDIFADDVKQIKIVDDELIIEKKTNVEIEQEDKQKKKDEMQEKLIRLESKISACKSLNFNEKVISLEQEKEKLLLEYKEL